MLDTIFQGCPLLVRISRLLRPDYSPVVLCRSPIVNPCQLRFAFILLHDHSTIIEHVCARLYGAFELTMIYGAHYALIRITFLCVFLSAHVLSNVVFVNSMI